MASFGVEFVDGLRRKLGEVGYSDDAVKDILKWYKRDSSDKRA